LSIYTTHNSCSTHSHTHTTHTHTHTEQRIVHPVQMGNWVCGLFRFTDGYNGNVQTGILMWAMITKNKLIKLNVLRNHY
jgi:hypothetical protein